MALTPLAHVREHVLARCPALAAVDVALADAFGLVAAEAVVASDPLPPFANSAMDGFAVRSADVTTVPARLEVIATIAAGADPSGIDVTAGQATRIMTGAALPSGADAVVMIEETDGGANGTVEIRRSVGPGDFVRAPGDDVRAGDVVVRAGDTLSPARVGLAAAVGRASVLAHPRPRVAVLSTGDELVGPGVVLRPGQIRDSNRLLLLGMVAEAGGTAADVGVIADDKDAIATALASAAAEHDAIITSGGVSVGDFDYLAPALAGLGEVTVFRMAIKPAKPFVFGVIESGGRHVPVFALPGNPVSAAVSFELLARPALRAMAGHPESRLDRPFIAAVADAPLRRSPDGKTHYIRVAGEWRDDGRLHVAPSGHQGSHVLSALAGANALAVLADGDGVGEGDDVAVMLLTG